VSRLSALWSDRRGVVCLDRDGWPDPRLHVPAMSGDDCFCGVDDAPGCFKGVGFEFSLVMIDSFR
jgi:hypothetical protein